MKCIHFIGIDVSKDFFDVAYLKAEAVGEAENTPHRVQNFANDPKGFAEFCAQYADMLPLALTVLEATGGYETALITALLSRGICVHRADPLTAKHFIRSLRRHGKTDRLDALALARYGQERHHSLSVCRPTDADQQKLKLLTARRADLIQMRVMEANRLKHPLYQGVLSQSVEAMLKAIAAQMLAIEEEIQAIVRSSESMQAKMRTLTQVCGVGVQTAVVLLADMPELGTLSRRQAASLAGLAPHPRDSGTLRGYRRTMGGRANVRRALFMAAMSARRCNPQLKEFYERLIKNGKKPIVALTAIMRKLITILNAKLRDEIYATTW